MMFIRCFKSIIHYYPTLQKVENHSFDFEAKCAYQLLEFTSADLSYLIDFIINFFFYLEIWKQHREAVKLFNNLPFQSFYGGKNKAGVEKFADIS